MGFRSDGLISGRISALIRYAAVELLGRAHGLAADREMLTGWGAIGAPYHRRFQQVRVRDVELRNCPLRVPLLLLATGRKRTLVRPDAPASGDRFCQRFAALTPSVPD